MTLHLFNHYEKEFEYKHCELFLNDSFITLFIYIISHFLSNFIIKLMDSKPNIKNSDDKRNSNRYDLINRNSLYSKLDEEGNDDFDNDKIKKVFEKVS